MALFSYSKMAVVEGSVDEAETTESGVTPRFITRQQERNRKKKLKKKASKQRKREAKANPDAQFFESAPSTDSASEEVPPKEYPVFELTGPFERFKVKSNFIGLLCTYTTF